jgi:imidazolonepropionase-like amidohydrolase
MSRLSFSFAVLLAGVRLASAAESPGVIAFRNARILPVAGGPIEDGVLVVENGKITAVGPKGTAIPAGATVRDLPAGSVIIPGLVDSHSHIGIYPRPSVPAHGDGNEMSGPVQGGLRALDAVWPDDPGIRMATAGGVTTANIMPGSGNVIGGATIYVKLRGRTIDDMRVKDCPVLGGLKMANGENPKGYGRGRPGAGGGQAPFTRMKVAALQREALQKAKDYRDKWAAYRKAKDAGDKSAKPPETDLNLEQLVEVLDRKRTVHFHCHRADDILTAVRLSEEFGFELVLQHCTEGFRIADELAKRKMPASLTLVDSPGGKLETAGLIEENAALLEKAGVPVAINTDDFITESRFFLRTGAIALRGGMSEASALRALTLVPASMLHLEKHVGSLEPGKDADLVVLSGAPFSVYTQVLETYIDGRQVFERQRDWPYQAGGFAVADRSRLPKMPEIVAPRDRPTLGWGPLPAQPAKPADGKLVILADRAHTVAGATIEDCVIVVEKGRIASIGSKVNVNIPADAKQIRAHVVTPGLIDAHSCIGLTGAFNVPADQDQDEASDPNQADLRALDGFNPDEPLMEHLRQNGVTVIHAVPGRVNVIAGQTGVFRTHGHTATAMALKFPAGLLINLGETPKTTYPGKGPLTRMAVANLVRTALAQARDGGDDKKPRNAKLDALKPFVRGELPVYISAHRADDILTGLRLAEEFKLKPVLDLATEAYLVADRVADAKTPVVVHPTMQRAGSSMETLNGNVANAAALADRGISVTIGTGYEGYVPKTRVLRYEAAMAAANGLGRDRALRAVTLDAARLLGIADRFGSIEVGKVADLVLYDGDPFEHATHVTHTLIDGQVVWDREEHLKTPFARRALPLMIGGGGAGCCMGW